MLLHNQHYHRTVNSIMVCHKHYHQSGSTKTDCKGNNAYILSKHWAASTLFTTKRTPWFIVTTTSLTASKQRSNGTNQAPFEQNSLSGARYTDAYEFFHDLHSVILVHTFSPLSPIWRVLVHLDAEVWNNSPSSPVLLSASGQNAGLNKICQQMTSARWVRVIELKVNNQW